MVDNFNKCTEQTVLNLYWTPNIPLKDNKHQWNCCSTNWSVLLQHSCCTDLIHRWTTPKKACVWQAFLFLNPLNYHSFLLAICKKASLKIKHYYWQVERALTSPVFSLEETLWSILLLCFSCAVCMSLSVFDRIWSVLLPLLCPFRTHNFKSRW